MSHELSKTYDPGAIEPRWAEYWVREKLFSVKTPDPGSEEAKKVFTLLLPPPNVTGSLHIGHMFEHTEMDIIIRWRRMRGFLTMWLPGTDHAGIATQMMVERQLASEGTSRQAMGRDKFIARVWEWKRHYGGQILKQMKRLGDSVDWDREYFTMDENLSRCVTEAFVRLHEEGLIYRGAYIVNWCPRCITAISDLEVMHEEFPGKLYSIRYPYAQAEGQSEAQGKFITVSTTRPETMLGDTAIAVNPRDERYKNLIGKKVTLPLMKTNRQVPIIADDYADPQFGSGAVKVTPAHDPNDFQIGLRHNLEQINVMDEEARINENGGAYKGLDRYEAREKVLHDLEKLGLLAGVKDHVYAIGKCDRCKTIVEPRLSTQWFMAVNKTPKHGGMSIAGAAKRAALEGSIRFTPENTRTIYLQWMENIHDWCISRQLWWGHRIPAWYCGDCNEIMVARTAPTQCKCGSTHLTQETDVLDTWFSSGLLPFTTLGWPEPTRDLEAFYPNSLLITGFDILFFWLARMAMFGCHFMMPPNRPALPADRGKEIKLRDAVPFREVYIHALVRDATRQKISKTKGNVIDPIEITEKYGTDAVRFTLASQAAPGTDIAFNESRTEGYRAFANKIWNAARFVFMNLDRVGGSLTSGAPAAMLERLENRWILSRFNRIAGEVNDGLAAYRFDEAANTIYSFFWGEFCDWYLEIIKPALLGPEHEARAALAFLGEIFEGALRLLSPFMPFITEEIWHAVYEGKPPKKSIALARYPERDRSRLDDRAESDMAILQDLIRNIRDLRADSKVEPKLKTPVRVHAGAAVCELIRANRGTVERLASAETIEFVQGSLAEQGSVRATPQFEVAIVYEQKIDMAAERERLTKEIKKIEAQIANMERQLDNPQFLTKAPAHVVEGLRKQLAELKILLAKLRAALDTLG